MRRVPTLQRALLIAPALLAADCGTSSGNSKDPNALVGTWQANEYPGGMMPPSTESYSQEITFREDKTFASVITQKYSSDAASYGACLETYRITGTVWSTQVSGSSMVVSIRGLEATDELTGCRNSSRNHAPSYSSVPSIGPDLSNSEYTLMDNTLTLRSQRAGDLIMVAFRRK
jgi:hypothetical protein